MTIKIAVICPNCGRVHPEADYMKTNAQNTERDMRFCLREQLRTARTEAILAYERGYVDGLTAYAWWKDGVQYVGTCGQTLEATIDLFKKGIGRDDPTTPSPA